MSNAPERPNLESNEDLKENLVDIWKALAKCASRKELDSGSVQSISMGVMPSLFAPTSLRISSWMLGESSAIFNLSPLGVRVAFVRFHYSTPFGRGVFIIGKGGAL